MTMNNEIRSMIDYLFSRPDRAMFNVRWKGFDVAVGNVFIDGIILQRTHRTSVCIQGEKRRCT